jgi:hypothetical protein
VNWLYGGRNADGKGKNPVAAAPGGAQVAPGGAAQQEVRFFKSFEALKGELGPAGEGRVWHHVVEQRAANIEQFGAEAIHNTQNVVVVPRAVNQTVANYYSSVRPSFTGNQTVRQWLGTQSWREQYEFGQRILKQASAGQPLP